MFDRRLTSQLGYVYRKLMKEHDIAQHVKAASYIAMALKTLVRKQADGDDDVSTAFDTQSQSAKNQNEYKRRDAPTYVITEGLDGSNAHITFEHVERDAPMYVITEGFAGSNAHITFEHVEQQASPPDCKGVHMPGLGCSQVIHLHDPVNSTVVQVLPDEMNEKEEFRRREVRRRELEEEEASAFLQISKTRCKRKRRHTVSAELRYLCARLESAWESSSEDDLALETSVENTLFRAGALWAKEVQTHRARLEHRSQASFEHRSCMNSILRWLSRPKAVPRNFDMLKIRYTVKTICLECCGLMNPDHLLALARLVIGNEDAQGSALDILKEVFHRRPEMFLCGEGFVSEQLCAILGCGLVDFELFQELREEEGLVVSGVVMTKLWPAMTARPGMFTQYRNLVSDFFRAYCDHIVEVSGNEVFEDANGLLPRLASSFQLALEDFQEEYDVMDQETRSEHMSTTSHHSSKNSTIQSLVGKRPHLSIDEVPLNMFEEKVVELVNLKIRDIVRDLVKIACKARGGCAFVVASKSAFEQVRKDCNADYQIVDRHPRWQSGYMTSQLKGLKVSDRKFREKVFEMSKHEEGDRWPLDHEARGLPKDGFTALVDDTGYRLKSAVRLVGFPTPPARWDNVGTRHLAALSISWVLRDYSNVTIVASESGSVHVLISSNNGIKVLKALIGSSLDTIAEY